MEGRLREKDMDQLEQWIGDGPKTFTLLYAITRDGCSATTFHQKCDNQGPTVTVLYTPQGSVYGGYNGEQWDSSSGWVNTTNAFLYRLHYNHSSNPVKFAVKKNTAVYYTHLSCGPIFGGNGSNDLFTFSNQITASNETFTLNGNMDGFGTTYDNQGITSDQVNNGSMVVTELEVYKVTAGERRKLSDKPWRKTREWTTEYLEVLKEKVNCFKPEDGLNVNEVRVLMVGQVGAGKSSFINTIDSIYRGRMSRVAPSGSTEQSLTTSYKPYKIRTGSGDKINVRLCDTRGLEESRGIDTVEFNYLLEGNVPEYYKFHPTSPIGPKIPGFKKEPSVSDTIHCVVFVIDATSLEILPTKIIDKIKSFQKFIIDKEIPQLILLTKIDKVCKAVNEDVANVFKSDKIKDHVEKASELFGLPRGDVLPVKNYESEAALDDNISTLALMSLQQMLHYADDYLVNLKDKMGEAKEKCERQSKPCE